MGKHIDRHLDKIYDEIDSLLLQEKFDVCEIILRGVQIYSMSTENLLGYLTVTLPAREKIPYRLQFYKAVEDEIKRRGEYQEGLLDGLA